MKVNQNELIEFADDQKLQVFGNGKFITSKIRSIQRLIQRGLLLKPKWEGDNCLHFGKMT